MVADLRYPHRQTSPAVIPISIGLEEVASLSSPCFWQRISHSAGLCLPAARMPPVYSMVVVPTEIQFRHLFSTLFCIFSVYIYTYNPRSSFVLLLL